MSFLRPCNRMLCAHIALLLVNLSPHSSQMCASASSPAPSSCSCSASPSRVGRGKGTHPGGGTSLEISATLN
eukprot:14546678-Heterocapsa_arctica.AAC.1